MNWRWVSIAAFLGALVMIYGVFVGRDRLDMAETAPPERPGYYLRDAIVTETQADGLPGMRLVAQRIEQQPDDSFIAHDVRIEYLKIPDEPWTLTAERGRVPPDSSVLELTGNVRLEPAGAQAPPGAGLATEALAIDTERHLAYTTTAPVSVRFGNHVMKVAAFQADLATRKIKWESVNGSLER